jgi:hypothetical protein
MKSRYFLPFVLLIGLTACGQQVGSSGQPLQADADADESAAPVNELRDPNEEVTAEEIQQRREAWVRADMQADVQSLEESRVASSGEPPRP